MSGNGLAIAIFSCSATMAYSGSVGSSKSAVNLMLPWLNCGKPGVFGLPGSRFEAVSSGGNRICEFRNFSNAGESDPDNFA